MAATRLPPSRVGQNGSPPTSPPIEGWVGDGTLPPLGSAKNVAEEQPEVDSFSCGINPTPPQQHRNYTDQVMLIS